MYEDNRPAAPGRLRRRPVLVTGAAVALLLALGLAGVAALTGPDEPAEPLWRAGPMATPVAPTSAASTPTPEPTADKPITMSATGDIIMGDAPERLPPRGGKGFFADVRRSLAADLVMGNLEEPLTDDTGYRKCRPPTRGPDGKPRRSGCHQFRAPPAYAAHLRDAGFQVLNQANNHGNDFGPAGYRNTQTALERYDLRHTGAPDQITVVQVRGVRVAVIGFSSYAWSNSLTDLAEARRVVRAATERADLVVVQVHMGAEGSDRTRVRPGTEIFFGENRGDPVRFSHAVIEAGADLVVGHGPHVLRAMEFHRGRLIAYSLGNFAGAEGTLSNDGRLGWSGVLHVSLRPDGSFAGGRFVSTYLNGAGRPTVDDRRRGLGLVRDLCRQDFPDTGARLDEQGAITAPAA